MPLFHQFRECRIAFTDDGEGGPTLLFLHGYGSSRIEWGTHTADFQTRFRCLSLDLPGHGDSGLPAAKDATLQFQIEAVVSLIESRGCGPVVAIGHSMGGRIAAHIALHQPDLVAALILVNAPADQPLSVSLRIFTLITPSRVAAWLMNRRGFFRGITRRYSSNMVRTPGELTRRKAESLRTMRQRSDFPARMHFLIRLGKSVLKDDLNLHLHRIEASTLIIWGDSDPTCPLSSARLIADRVSDSRLVIIVNSAHNPHLEHYGQFSQVLLDFLNHITLRTITAPP